MEQKEINLDTLFANKHAEPTETVLVVEEQKYVDFGRILNEVSYKLPKGYPTVVDGVFTEREEIIIINEALEAEGLSTLPLPEVELYLPEALTEPNSKDTEFKEGMVVYFLGLGENDFKAYLDYFNNPTLNIKLPNYIVPKKIKYYKGPDLKIVENGIKYLYKNSKNFKNEKALGGYIQPFSTAYAIREMFGRQDADRGALFATLKEKAAGKATDLIGERVLVDKWCPADMFIYGGNSSFNFDKKSLYTGNNSINSTFVIEKASLTGEKIVGISLKESEARAGKAKSFQDVLTRKDNYEAAPTLAPDLKAHISILYHTEEFLKKPEGKLYYLSEVVRRLSKIELQTKESTYLLKILQPIVVKAFGSVLGKNNAKKIADTKTLSTNQINKLAKAVQSYSDSIQKQATNIYNTYRKAFYTEVTRLKYKTDSGKSKLESKDPHVLLKKAGCYQIATWFMTGLDKGDLDIPKEFKSLSKERGIFVALTAYAVGMAGISPNFLKAKGSSTADGGHVEPFYGSGYLNAVGNNMVVRDSKDFKGFQVDVITAAYESNEKGAKPKTNYKTTLDFRYSGDALFIEVGRLDVLK
ncbi:MAG: hypothetical protein F2817_20910 [Actinobacteria bacterium]|nr:hypothetical protein [Actinomycetota bacterium]